MNQTAAIMIPFLDAERTLHGAIPARPLALLWSALTQHPILSPVILSTAGLAFSITGGLPYGAKRLIDAITRLLTLTEQPATFRSIWWWGGFFCAGLASAAGLLRCSHLAGIRTITRMKTETYRRLFRCLMAVEFSDDPGAAMQSIALVGEGLESLFFKAFWQLPHLAIVLIVHLCLMVTAQPVMGGMLAGWILLYLVSQTLLLKRQKGFAVKYQQSTSRFKSLLVEFCRMGILHPERWRQAHSDELYHLDQALVIRNERHQRTLQIGEAIHLLSNLLHTLSIALATIMLIVLWQERVISVGDVAMGITILLSTQHLLEEASPLLHQCVDEYRQVEAGLLYLHTKSEAP